MPPGSVETIHNGVDLESFTPEGRALRAAARPPACTFLFVGGTTWRKGADVLIEGWRRAFGPGDDVQLVVKDFGVNGAYRNQTDRRRDPRARRVAARPRRSSTWTTHLPVRRAARALPRGRRGGAALPRRGLLPARARGDGLRRAGDPQRRWARRPSSSATPAAGRCPPRARRCRRTCSCPSSRPATATSTRSTRTSWPRACARSPPTPRSGASAAPARSSRPQSYSLGRASPTPREASLAALEAEGLPLARELRRAEIEARTHFAVYAPDWSDEATWGPALDAWLDAFGPGDDVTLALYAEGDAEAIGGRDDGPPGRRATSRRCPTSRSSCRAPWGSSRSPRAPTPSWPTRPTDPAARPELLRRARRIVAARRPRRDRALRAALCAPPTVTQDEMRFAAPQHQAKAKPFIEALISHGHDFVAGLTSTPTSSTSTRRGTAACTSPTWPTGAKVFLYPHGYNATFLYACERYQADARDRPLRRGPRASATWRRRSASRPGLRRRLPVLRPQAVPGDGQLDEGPVRRVAPVLPDGSLPRCSTRCRAPRHELLHLPHTIERAAPDGLAPTARAAPA